MSTLTGEEHTTLIQSEQDLENYFARFQKLSDLRLIGIEAEYFVVDRKSGKALPYEGPGGIHAILRRMAEQFHYEPLAEGPNVIGLKKGNKYIALEPGGQMELSAPPVKTVFEVEEQLQEFQQEIRSLAQTFPQAAWLAAGIHPFSGLEDIPWVPKKRYEIMERHFKTHGRLSHHMMKRTATNHFNFDYTSEEDAMEALRTVLSVTSIATALFANSSISEGKPSGFKTERLHIWNHTDPDRSGLIIPFIRSGGTFKDYLDYILEMPVIFIVRNKEWHPVNRLSFRQFIHQGFEGARATLGDFELHLSTAFPEARFKQYLEVRGTDCQRPDLTLAAAAFWKGILYDESARRKTLSLTADWSEEERIRIHEEVPRTGLQTKIRGREIFSIAEELARLAGEGLQGLGSKEVVYLSPIANGILRLRKSPGELLLADWEKKFRSNPAALIERLQIG